MKRVRTILILVGSIILIISLLIMKTYSLINDYDNKDIHTIFINDNKYTDIYYIVRDKTELTDGEMNMLINSSYINKLYNYIINNNLDKSKLYDVISKYILLDNNISDEIKSKLINECKKYIKEISDYLY